jgi:hypothetical protein
MVGVEKRISPPSTGRQVVPVQSERLGVITPTAG